MRASGWLQRSHLHGWVIKKHCTVDMSVLQQQFIPSMNQRTAMCNQLQHCQWMRVSQKSRPSSSSTWGAPRDRGRVTCKGPQWSHRRLIKKTTTTRCSGRWPEAYLQFGEQFPHDKVARKWMTLVEADKREKDNNASAGRGPVRLPILYPDGQAAWGQPPCGSTGCGERLCWCGGMPARCTEAVKQFSLTSNSSLIQSL